MTTNDPRIDMSDPIQAVAQNKYNATNETERIEEGMITFSLNEEQWDELIKLLEADPQPDKYPKLNELLTKHNGFEIVSLCPACGSVIDYCQGHGEIGDPNGHAILGKHDYGDHSECHIDAKIGGECEGSET